MEVHIFTLIVPGRKTSRYNIVQIYMRSPRSATAPVCISDLSIIIVCAVYDTLR